MNNAWLEKFRTNLGQIVGLIDPGDIDIWYCFYDYEDLVLRLEDKYDVLEMRRGDLCYYKEELDEALNAHVDENSYAFKYGRKPADIKESIADTERDIEAQERHLNDFFNSVILAQEEFMGLFAERRPEIVQHLLER